MKYFSHVNIISVFLLFFNLLYTSLLFLNDVPELRMCFLVLWFGPNGVVPHIFCIIFLIHVISFNDIQSLVLSSTNHLQPAAHSTSLVGVNFLHAKFSISSTHLRGTRQNPKRWSNTLVQPVLLQRLSWMCRQGPNVRGGPACVCMARLVRSTTGYISRCWEQGITHFVTNILSKV
jgi:hypothetical protein